MGLTRLLPLQGAFFPFVDEADGEDEEDECYDRLDDPKNVVLQH